MKPTKRPPWVYTRIIRASTIIKPTWKLIWLEHYGLWVGRRGAFISASGLGRRLSLGRVTIERARQDFLRWDLIKKGDQGIGRTAAWYVQLPANCRPQGTRLVDDDVERYAELLDAHITSRMRDGGRSTKKRLQDIPPSLHEGGFHTEPSRQGEHADMSQMSEVLPHGLSEVSTLHEVLTDGEDGEDGHTGTDSYPRDEECWE